MKKQPLSKVILSIIFILVGMLLSQVITGIPSSLVLSINEYTGLLVYTLLYNSVTFLMVYLIIRYFLKDSLQAYGIGKPGLKLPWVLLGIALPIICLLIISIIVPGKWGIIGTEFELKETIFGLIIYVGLFGSVIEEVIYHGLIYPLLRQRLSVFNSAILTGVIFALSHMINKGWTVTSAIIFLSTSTAISVFLGYLTEETKSVWNSAWIHFIWNVMSSIINVSMIEDARFLFNYIVVKDIPLLTGGEGGITSSIVVVFLMTIMSIIIVYRNKNLENI